MMYHMNILMWGLRC